ncbi:MAG: serine/threonine protein kinase [Polyangiaceae bacterium]|nr:serine/threonine protein kinase [Polyangiaceae bacterium]
MSIRSALHAAPFLALDEGRTATRGFVGTVPMAGAFVTPSIRLDKPLARGGMGSVWRAEHQVLDAPVAVKFMSDGFLSNPEALERFRREAAALACIKSPHVVQVFDFGVTRGGLPYIVMELLEGETLQDRIERYGRLPARLTIDLVRQVGIALSKAHDLGIVHRDIKPENVFLIEAEHDIFVKVLDFGIASQIGVGVDEVVGTPHFMAPEQMDGHAVDTSADVWALGVVAYYALTGKLPFEGRDLSALSKSARRGPKKPLSHLLTEAAPGLELWVAAALEPDPFLRYPDARAALDALDELLRGTDLDVDPEPKRHLMQRVHYETDDDDFFTTLVLKRLSRRRLASRSVAIGAILGFAAFAVYAIGGSQLATQDGVRSALQRILPGEKMPGFGD